MDPTVELAWLPVELIWYICDRLSLVSVHRVAFCSKLTRDALVVYIKRRKKSLQRPTLQLQNWWRRYRCYGHKQQVEDYIEKSSDLSVQSIHMFLVASEMFGPIPHVYATSLCRELLVSHPWCYHDCPPNAGDEHQIKKCQDAVLGFHIRGSGISSIKLLANGVCIGRVDWLKSWTGCRRFIFKHPLLVLMYPYHRFKIVCGRARPAGKVESLKIMNLCIYQENRMECIANVLAFPNNINIL